MTIQLPNDRFSSPRAAGLCRSVAAVLGALAVSSFVLACGGGGSSGWQPGAGGETGSDPGSDVGAGGKSDHATNTGTAAGDGSTNAEGGSPIVNCDERPTQTVTLNQPIWQTGFKVTLGTATLKPQTPSCSPGILTIDAQFENRGTDAETFDAETLLSSSGTDYELPRAQDLPNVPGGRLGKGTFAFAVDGTFSLDDAVLSFGGAGRHQAKVPFGKDSPDSLITLEPQTLPIKGKVVAGNLAINFEDVLVRADSPGDFTSVAADEVQLLLDFSAMVTKDLRYADFIEDEAFVLELPDGTSVAPDYSSFKDLDKGGVTVDGMWLRFAIPTPASGKYSLEVRERDGIGNTGAKAVFPFTLPSFPTFGDK